MPMSTPTLNDTQSEICAHIGRGDFAGAAAAAAACRRSWPSDRAGWLLGSIAALHADQKDTALALVNERLDRYPDDLRCLLQRAECLLALGERTAAVAAADAAAAVVNSSASAQELPAALDAVGEFLVHVNEHQRALQVYDRAIDAAPEDSALRAKRATLHRFVGNFDLAARDYDAILKKLPLDADALTQKAELHRQTAENNSIAAMQAALAATPSGSIESAMLQFGLAKSYEDLDQYAESWRHLSSGNKIERARIQYNQDQDRAVIERIIQGFPTIEQAAPDTTNERPIFIVGLPRTGTTLVDRILGSHSQIYSAGELSALSEAIGAMCNARYSRHPRNGRNTLRLSAASTPLRLPAST